MEILFTVFKSQGRHDFETEIIKGAYFNKIIGRVMLLNLCTSTDNVLEMYQVSRKYFKAL